MTRRIYLGTGDIAEDVEDLVYDATDDSYADAGDPRADALYGDEEQQAGLFGNRSRTFTLAGSLVMLLAVLSTIVWLLSARTADSGPSLSATTGNGANIAGLEQAPRVGALAPDFELVDVHTNKTLKLSSLRGKPVFMNFWGTWCPPCRAEMPEMQKIYNKYKGQLEMLGVTMAPRDEPQGVRTFVDAAKYNWTFVHDADYGVATTYQIEGVPSSYFIDKSGVIRTVHIGAMNYDQMEKYLEQIR